MGCSKPAASRLAPSEQSEQTSEQTRRFAPVVRAVQGVQGISLDPLGPRRPPLVLIHRGPYPRWAKLGLAGLLGRCTRNGTYCSDGAGTVLGRELPLRP